MLVAYPKFRIRQDHLDTYREAAKELITDSLLEPGVVSYGVFEDISDSDVFVHVEVYDDQEAFDAHVASAHVGRFLDTLNTARHPDPEIHIFHVARSEMVDID